MNKIVRIDNLRNELITVITTVQDLVSEAKPPVVQELVLAQRHLEDARMRLGVARTYEEGENPLGSR